ncbi:MAG TPA: sugar phosphate isomerase/epimerase family protein [Bryobacteraceae bacterium]|nr:sugar phosphate isomerase/epimerase family protein [Bryobacteraceae bacterium]
MESPSRRTVLLSAGAATLSALAKTGAALAKTRGIELGVCGAPDSFAKAEHYGFDYFEPGGAAIAAMTDSAFASFREQVLASRIRCRSFNSLIRTLRVVGDDANLDAVSAYLDSTLDRCRTLGARVAVWGSASSRQVPPGYSREVAWNQIKTFLARAGDIAKAKQMVIGIEPQRKQESNIINTGAEALRLVSEVNHPQVKMIIDYYHLRVEQEDPEIVLKARNEIVHLHFANPNGRLWPKLADEDAEYDRFFSILKQINYTGGLSIEGNGTFENDAAASLAFFRGELK